MLSGLVAAAAARGITTMAACMQIWLGSNMGILIMVGDTTTVAEVVDMVMVGAAMVGVAGLAAAGPSGEGKKGWR